MAALSAVTSAAFVACHAVEAGREVPAAGDSVIRGLERSDGFFPFYWDGAGGRVLIEIPRFESEFLYTNGLTTGLGSNPVGLDRGRFGRERIVRFRRVGPRVLLVQRNLRYRATSESRAERRAVEESFARSVLWGTKVLEERDGRVIVDATGLLFQDVMNVARTLKQNGQGDYRIDAERSAVWLPGSKAFPENTELEVDLTFVARNPGRHVRETAPTPEAVTLRMHHSLVKLPDDGYVPRRFDPRSSSMALGFADYSQPIQRPLMQRFLSRHRLEKQDPNAAVSKAVEPILYHVDPGAPEPVRSALLEGASWWNEAFEAAGFEDAFQVALLPEGADPMDLRYNVIQWVHRSTRGWSYGRSVRDPRTGEILKGHVTLGSLRVRQDRLLLEGLAPRYTDAACEAGACPFDLRLAELDPETEVVEVALARIRQLAAHEVGHTLGFAHNFAASARDRASVMDYPAPLIRKREDGSLDFGDAYDAGIGEWDKLAVRHAYSVFPEGSDEARELERIVQEGIRRGLLFLSDADARPPGAMHPLASLWDNGKDPIAELEHVLDIRRTALGSLGESSVPPGEPRDRLEQLLLPLYLHHRYQVSATAKLLGGASHDHALRGDARPVLTPVPPERQKAALNALLRTLSPEELVLPERLLALLAPRSFGSGQGKRFPRKTGQLFDPLTAARIAIDITLDGLLHAERAGRLVVFHARNPENPSLDEVLEAVVELAWSEESGSGLAAACRRVLRRAVAEKLMHLAGDDQALGDVRSSAHAALQRLESGADDPELGASIRRFLARPHRAEGPRPRVSRPAGSPIGR